VRNMSRRVLIVLALATLIVVAVGLWMSRQPGGRAADGDSEATFGPTHLPSVTHIYLIVLENKSPDQLDPGSAPYWNWLADHYWEATNYHGIAHPSQPNYLALFSGNTQGVDDDAVHDLDAPNLADELEAHGRTWRVFAENVPPGCFVGASSSDGADGSGTYVRKHNPAISFASIRNNPGRCANITDFSHFQAGIANFNLIVPNLCHDMHDCTVAEGDAFLKSFVGDLLPKLGPTDLVFITFDESEGKDPVNPVSTLVIGPGVRAGERSDISYNHYSLLRTIEDAWSLGCLDEACEEHAITAVFR
jgi:hypothetical protein